MSDNVRSVDEWKRVLRAALGEAMRSRQMHAVAVLRETLSAIDNAEAAEPHATAPMQQGVFAGSIAGLGAGEVPRRVLGADEVIAIVEREITERRDAATMYEALGRHDEARILNLQLDVLLALR
jgi:uncharacterized protein